MRIRGIFDELGAANASSDDEALCAAGVPVRVEQTAGKMHNKLMVLDAGGADPRVVTGSLNWTAAGDERNSENIVILHDARGGADLYGGLCAVVEARRRRLPRGQRAAAASVYLPLVSASAGRKHAGAHVDLAICDGRCRPRTTPADGTLRLHGQPVQLRRLQHAGPGAVVFRLVHAGGGHGCAPAGQRWGWGGVRESAVGVESGWDGGLGPRLSEN